MQGQLEEQEQDIWLKILVPLHSLNNIKITEYFNYEATFHGVFSGNNLTKIKDGAYVINIDDKKSKGEHWVLLFSEKHLAVYFGSFGIEYIPQ